MGRYSSDTGGGDFTPAPEGTHVARCIELIDIGTQHGEYLGEPTKRNQIIVRWELPNETIQIDGKPEPMLVSKFYTNSLGEKANLRADLTSWRGRAFTKEELDRFDLMNILGKPCLLTVVHTDKGKAKVNSVSGLAKGMTCPPQSNQSKAFFLDDWNGDVNGEPFMSLPKGFRELILKSDEYKELAAPPGVSAPPAGADKHVDTFNDDIPFVLNECVHEIAPRFIRRIARGCAR